MVQVIVIGVGSMGWNHARVCSELGILSGICDGNEETAHSVSKRFDVPGFSSLDQALKEVNPTAAIVATPTSTHHEVAKKLLHHGCHVLIEKPLVSEIAQGEDLIQLSSELKLTLAVGHIERHNPVVRRAKEHLQSGEWGELITINSRRVSSFTGRINDVGAVLDVGIHDIDNLKYTLEESEIGYENFCVIETFIKSIEWLYLAAKGHRRAYFSLKNNSLEKKWLIP